MPYQIAQIQAARDDPDATFEWLDRAVATKDPGIAFLPSDPFLMRYRGDPRLTQVALKAGLRADSISTSEAVPMGR
jgi:hypothetical protein